MKTLVSLLAFGLLIGCGASQRPRQIPIELKLEIITAHAEAITATQAAMPYVQTAIAKEALRDELIRKALVAVKCPTCKVDLVNSKVVVIEPAPAPKKK